jgi:parallel beta-helix repeat protein
MLRRAPALAFHVVAVLGLSLAGVLVAATPSIADTSSLYVDASNPQCSNTGPGSPTQPFCSIGTAATLAVAGQTVVVAAGTYAETVTAKQSGTAGLPIVYTAAPAATVTVAGPTYGFVISGRSWITVQGFTVTGTSKTGISVSSSSNITISGNRVSNAGQPIDGKTAQGIKLNDTTDSLVSSNTSNNNSEAGILLTGATTRTMVIGNTTFENARGYTRAAPGIDVRSSGNTIQANVSHDNEDSGLQFYTGGGGNLVVDNVSYHNGDHGIDDLNAPGQQIIGNTVFGNVAAGINLEGTSSGGTLVNNISVDNGINSPRTASNIRLDSQSIANATLRRDLVNLSPSGTIMFIWGKTSYPSLAAFQSATGQEVGGVQGDPRWAAPAAGDFRLTAGSPAVDSADSGAGTSTDCMGHPRVDDPATVDTGVGPRTFDDRGAYEYQPDGSDAPPIARLTVTPGSGTAPVAVTADASASTDTDGTPIATYQFDFGDGTIVDPQATPTALHTYTTAGAFTVSVTVADTAGLASTAPAPVAVSPAPPPTTTTTAPPTPTTTTTTTTTTLPGGGGPNLVGNPGFEVDTAGWGPVGAGITLQRVAGGHTGGWAAQLANATTSSATVTLNDSPNWVTTTSPGTYTATMWARANAGTVSFKLKLREYQGSTLVGSATTTVNVTTAWQLVTVTYVPVAPGATTLDLTGYVSSAATGVVFLVDDVTLTRG